MLDTYSPELTDRADFSLPDDDREALERLEFRQVANLCIALRDLSSSQNGPEQETGSPHLAKTADMLTALLSTHGVQRSVIERLSGRDRGLLINAILSTNSSGSNEAEIAVQAAIAAATRMKGWNRRLARNKAHVDIHIGIHYGDATVATDGTFLLHHDVNKVSRGLALAAPSEHILITAEVRTLLEDLFHYEGMGSIYIQGSSKPLETYRVIGRNSREGHWQRSRLVRRAQMVGRDKELETLEQIYRRASEPESRQWKEGKTGRLKPFLVDISGPKGCGKSRLLHEFRRNVSPFKEGSLSPLSGRAESIYPVPYAIFRAILKNLFGVRSADSMGVRRKKLQAGMAPFSKIEPELSTYLSVLSFMVGIDREDQDEQSARMFQVDVRNAFTMLIRAAAIHAFNMRGAPLLIYLKNLHGLHARSRATLISILRQLNLDVPLVIFASHRPGFELPEEIREATVVYELPLTPLSRDAQRAIIRSMLDIKEFPRSLEARILEKGGGNPYFVEELVRSLVDKRVVVYGDGRWQLNSTVKDVELPPTLNALVSSRLDALERPLRDLLIRASVIGELVNPDILEDMETELDHPPLLPLFRRLVETRLLRPIGHESEQGYAFENPLVREVCYKRLVPKNRKLLHRLAAKAVLRRLSSELDHHYLELASHFQLADNPAEAARYYRLAGEEAVEEFDHELALDCFTKCLSLSHESAELRNVRWQMARVFRLLGHADEAANVLAVLVKEIIPTDGESFDFKANVLVEQARVLHRIGRIPEALEHCQEALAMAKRGDNRATEGDAYVVVGKCLRLQSKQIEALESFHHALAVYQDLGDQAGAARVLSNLGQIALDRNDVDQAKRLFEQALKIQKKLQDRWGIALEIGHLGVTEYESGNLAAAEAHFLKCSSQAETYDIRLLAAACKMYLGLIKARYGAPDGLDSLDEGIQQATRLQDLPRQILGHKLKAEALEALHKDDAKLSLEAGRKLAEAAGIFF